MYPTGSSGERTTKPFSPVNPLMTPLRKEKMLSTASNNNAANDTIRIMNADFLVNFFILQLTGRAETAGSPFG